MVTSSKNEQWVPNSWRWTRCITSLGVLDDQGRSKRTRPDSLKSPIYPLSTDPSRWPWDTHQAECAPHVPMYPFHPSASSYMSEMLTYARTPTPGLLNTRFSSQKEAGILIFLAFSQTGPSLTSNRIPLPKATRPAISHSSTVTL